ncbi:MAG TPA: hypothetical protein PLS83_00405 [Methanothrix soehngenii]|nr:hypothetical protein [Methanothrix soehngenii]
MNHYLKNVVARNLHQTNVIQPRLTSRFEAETHYIPPSSDWRSSNLGNMRSNARDGVDQGRHSNNSVFVEGDPDFPSRRAPAETQGALTASQQSKKNRDQPTSEAANISLLRGQTQTTMPDQIETLHESASVPEETASDRLSSAWSSGGASDRKFKKDSKVMDRDQPEYQLSPEQSMIFCPIDEIQNISELSEPIYERKPIRDKLPGQRYEKNIPLASGEAEPDNRIYGSKPIGDELDGGRSEKKVPLASGEEELGEPIYGHKPIDHKSEDKRSEKNAIRASGQENRGSMEKKEGLKALDRPEPGPEEEIVPSTVVEEDNNGILREYGIRHKSGEPIMKDPLKTLVSSGMIGARPHIKSYFGPQENEASHDVAKPKTDPPVIVTIGRIEIRANSEVAAPQRRRTVPPAMSLEDYLKNKRGRL